MSADFQTWHFTVDEFMRMGELGILGPEAQVELIEGKIYPMNAIGTKHAAAVRKIGEALRDQLGKSVLVSEQAPILLDSRSQPQPDLSVVERRADSYENEHPTPADVFVVIEVANTTLAFDREIKLPVYASAGIPDCWLFDIQGRKLTWYSPPQGDRYLEQREFSPKDLFQTTVAGIAFELDLSRIL